jgi:L-serine deaminase
MTGAMIDAVSVVSGPQQKIPNGMPAAMVVGDLCKHNATLAAVNAMVLIAKETSSKYKETVEGGLAVSVVLC